MDPNLFDKLHGISPKKTKADDPALEKAIKEQVDYLLEDASPNPLLPPEARRAKLEQEVRTAADFSEFGKLFSSAYKILRNGNLSYLAKDEDEILQQSLDKLSQQLENLDLGEITDEKLKTALEMSSESQKLILKIGIAKYQHKLLDESLAIFTFLSIIDEEEPDYWYRLGLVAQILENYDLALRAYTTTSLLAPDFVEAHLYAAECYLQTGRPHNADTELKEAKKHLENNKSEELQEHILEIEQMIVKNRS